MKNLSVIIGTFKSRNVAIRIDHINACLDAQLEPETSFSALNLLTLAFLMKAVQEYSSRSDAQGVF